MHLNLGTTARATKSGTIPDLSGSATKSLLNSCTAAATWALGWRTKSNAKEWPPRRTRNFGTRKVNRSVAGEAPLRTGFRPSHAINSSSFLPSGALRSVDRRSQGSSVFEARLASGSACLGFNSFDKGTSEKKTLHQKAKTGWESQGQAQTIYALRRRSHRAFAPGFIPAHPRVRLPNAVSALQRTRNDCCDCDCAAR